MYLGLSYFVFLNFMTATLITLHAGLQIHS